MARAGRKRKDRARSPTTGRLLAAPKVDYKAMAGQQPHRSWLPEGLRTNEKAGTPLGALNLLKDREGNQYITDQQYEAGKRLAVRTGAYMAIIGTPRTTAGGGRTPNCKPDICEQWPEGCACRVVKAKYDEAYEALFGAGQPIAKITKQVAVHEETCTREQLPLLIAGLDTLCRLFGLDADQKKELQQEGKPRKLRSWTAAQAS